MRLGLLLVRFVSVFGRGRAFDALDDGRVNFFGDDATEAGRLPNELRPRPEGEGALSVAGLLIGDDFGLMRGDAGVLGLLPDLGEDLTAALEEATGVLTGETL